MRYILHIVILSCFFCFHGFNQINVFETNCLELDQSEFDSAGEEIRAGCINTPTDGSSHLFTPSAENKKMIASKQIVFSPNVIIEPTGSYSVDVVAFVDDLNTIEKLSKFELGIQLPEMIQTQIDNFLADNSGNQINPFLSNEIHVYAVFKYVTPLPPYLGVEDVQRDGFYYKEVDRDISGFDGLYNHPS